MTASSTSPSAPTPSSPTPSSTTTAGVTRRPGIVRILGVLRMRLLQMIPTLIGLTVITFLLVHLLPGGPAQALAGVRATPQVTAEVNQRLGLNLSLPSQYLRYLGDLVHGDLGTSFITGASVDSIIRVHLATTLLLIIYGVVIAVALGVPLAVIAAYRQGSWPDQAIRGVVVLSFGLPSFWIGLLLVTYFGLKLQWFPTGGAGTGLVEHLTHLFLPSLTLALTFLAVLVRSLRARLVELLHTDYVDAVRLKGVPGYRLLVLHVLRVAMVPVVALIGLNMSYLLGASVVLENVFALDGMGQQLVAAVLQRDFLVVQGIVLIFGILVVGIGLAAELIQASLDPRINQVSRG